MYQIVLLHDLKLLTYNVSPSQYNNTEVALQGFKRLSKTHDEML
jgi:hypothetical protein